MPLFFRKNLDANTQLGIWKMDETEEQLFEHHPFLKRFEDEVNTRFHNKTRRLEYLSIRVLTAFLIEDTTYSISYTKDGKPLLSDGRHISISHTKEYAAVIVSTTSQVAVDIERKGRNLQRIRSHFMRKDEVANNDDELLIHWCAKETMYKLFPDDHLMTEEIQVVFTKDTDRKSLTGINIKKNISVNLHCIDFQHLTITYSIL